MRRFLIVNPFGIGDVLFTTPIIEGIKSEHPENYLGYVCNIRTAPFILSNPNVDKTFIFEKDEYRHLWKISRRRCIAKLYRLLKDIRNEKFEICFDFSLAQEYGLFLKLAGIKERLGYNYRNRGIFLTKRIELGGGYSGKHIVEYYIGVLFLTGIRPPKDAALKIYLPDEDKQKAQNLLLLKGITDNEGFVCIVPGAGASWGASSFRKQWPKEHFAELAKALCEEAQIKVVLLGSDDEKPICDYIKNEEPRCINLCGETDLLTFSAIIAKAKLLITNDGGPLHIAVAQGTKTISIFGPVDEKVYGPFPPGERHLVIKNDALFCRPCYKNFKLPECKHKNCLEGISPDTAIKAAIESLRLKDEG